MIILLHAEFTLLSLRVQKTRAYKSTLNRLELSRKRLLKYTKKAYLLMRF